MLIAFADGGLYERINGTFAPTVPTAGFIGTIDAQCSQDGTCAQPLPGVAGLHFTSVQHDAFGAFTFTADAGACGTWHQTNSGDTGDGSRPHSASRSRTCEAAINSEEFAPIRATTRGSGHGGRSEE